MATQKKVLGNAFAQIVGKVLSVIASFVVVKIVTSFGKEFYGNYVTVYEFLAFFGIIADSGLFAIAVREMSKKPKDTEFILANIFSMRLLLILGVTLLAGISAQFIPSYSPLIKMGIWITGLSMALTIVAGTLSSVLQARMKIQYFSGGLVLGKVLLALFIFFIARNMDIFGMSEANLFLTMLLAGVISNLLFCGTVIVFVSREIRIRLGFAFEWWKNIFRNALPYGLALILQTLYLRVDVVIISLLLTASAVGVYGVSTRVLESFLVLGVFFGQAILPKMSSEEDNLTQHSKTLVWGMEMLLLFSLPIIIGISAFSSNIVSLLSSSDFLSKPGFLGSDTLLLILIPTVLFAYLNQLFSFALVSQNKQRYLLIVNGLALGANVALNLIFLPLYGLLAAALSTVVCELFVFGLLFRYVLKRFTLPFSFSNIFRILFMNGILAGLIYLTPLGKNFTMSAVAGSLLYFGMVWMQRKRFLIHHS